MVDTAALGSPLTASGDAWPLGSGQVPNVSQRPSLARREAIAERITP